MAANDAAKQDKLSKQLEQDRARVAKLERMLKCVDVRRKIINALGDIRAMANKLAEAGDVDSLTSLDGDITRMLGADEPTSPDE